MKKWMRGLRAAVGRGLTWAAAGFGAGLILVLVGLVVGGGADVPFPLVFALLGFLAGTTFGIVEIAERAEERELLEGRAEVAEAGLTEEEKRELLGGGG